MTGGIAVDGIAHIGSRTGMASRRQARLLIASQSSSLRNGASQLGEVRDVGLDHIHPE